MIESRCTLVDKKNSLKLIKQIDWKLVLIVTVIFLYGLIVLSSATLTEKTGNYGQIYRQLLAFVLGTSLICVILIFDYNFLGKYYKELYIVSLILLAAVLIPGIGVVRGGARSWINLGVLNFQTSELVKLTFILSYAKIVESKKGKLNTLKEIIPVLVYAAPFIGLLFAQPDLGTAIVFMCIVFGMLFTAGLSTKIIKQAFIVLVVSLPIIYMLMAPHQKVRIEAFLNPEDITLEGNYQVLQSIIAIGSGGIFGKGLHNGSQTQDNFLPVQDSDFIFAVVGEELGLIGMTAFLILFVLFLIRLIYIAKEAKDFYGTLIVVGVTSMFTYQIVQNIGMTVVLIPVTGVTLPFVSYGGSSLLTSLANLGLVLNVYMRKKKINF